MNWTFFLLPFCLLLSGSILGKSDEKENLAEDAVFDAYQNYRNGKEALRLRFRIDFAKALEAADFGEIYLLDFAMEKELPRDGILLGFVNEDYVSRDHIMKDRGEGDFAKEPTHFFVEPYEAFSKILGRKKLEGGLLEQCKEAAKELLRSPKNLTGAFCHYPIHGLRLVSEGSLIFQTSICYHCGNYYLHYPDSGMSHGAYRLVKEWVGFDGPKLEAFLKKEMPIPQSEIDRFKKEHGK